MEKTENNRSNRADGVQLIFRTNGRISDKITAISILSNVPAGMVIRYLIKHAFDNGLTKYLQEGDYINIFNKSFTKVNDERIHKNMPSLTLSVRIPYHWMAELEDLAWEKQVKSASPRHCASVLIKHSLNSFSLSKWVTIFKNMEHMAYPLLELTND